MRITAGTQNDSSPPSLATLLAGDCRRAARAAMWACLVAALVEHAATVVAAHDLRFTTALRLFALTITLFALAAPLAAIALACLCAGARLCYAALSRTGARRWRGLLCPSTHSFVDPSPAAAWLWAATVGVLIFVGTSTALNLTLAARFRAPTLTAVLLAVVQLFVIAVTAAICAGIAATLRRLATRLHPRLGRANPFGSVFAGTVLLVVIAAIASVIAIRRLPQLAPLLPWRQALTLGAFVMGAYLAATLFHKRRLLGKGTRRVATLGALALLISATAWRIGGDPETKLAATYGSPTLDLMLSAVTRANDLDHDGHATLFGGNDCAPFDATIHPGARDIPDNKIDENCDGRDFELGRLPSYRKGEDMPVPDAFAGPYNYLLLTVDTVRYDHTTMGGYAERTKRDTTPNLAALAARSTSFSFCQAPSAGTVASIPAILTSKFFHSGIALGPERSGKPPRIKDTNLLLPELLKQEGYTTGAVLSHDYFSDWGTDQGIDSYDNTLGARREPRGITSDRITDRGLAWMAKHTDDKWFLWLHYMDPHGEYVPHPGEIDFGPEPKDLYDGELYYTDKHVGRLLRHLETLPGADRTVVIVTSDHGDAFGEHGFVNHAQALYAEILHVPLIVYVPNNAPRIVEGPVSPMDIFPTIADLLGADTDKLALEGESLVPQLFYGKDATSRVVFAETNYRHTLRAAVTDNYKLIYDLKLNTYQLFDVKNDPGEKRNLHKSKPAAFAKIKGYLDDWLERVYYSRDSESNQTMNIFRKVLLDGAPQPQRPLVDTSIADSGVAVLGFDVDKESYKASDTAKVTLYFHAIERPSHDFRLQVEAWSVGDTPRAIGRSKARYSAGGVLPPTRWRSGEFLRDEFAVRIGTAAQGDSLELRLRTIPSKGHNKKTHSASMTVLGRVKLSAAATVDTKNPSPR